MEKRRVLALTILLGLIALLAGAVLAFHPTPQTGKTVQTISCWQSDSGQSLRLPCTLSGLSPRTPLSLTATVQPEAGDCLYLKTVYMPLRVYANGELLFEYGQPGSFPAFLLDPPTKPALIPLPGSEGPVTLRLEFQSPTQRSAAALSAVLMGDSSAILLTLSSRMGFSLCFSVFLIAFGVLLLLVAFIVTRFERTGTAFYWLGLFSLTIGCWVFGECNLTGVLIDAPALLYLAAFLGMFTLPLPLLRFGQQILSLSPPCAKLIAWLCRVLEISLVTTLLLQLTGRAAFSKTMYLFHLLLPVSLCIFTGVLICESLSTRNPLARKFLLPTAALAFFSLVELGNYYWFQLNVQKSFFFQLGVLLFILSISMQSGFAVRDIFLLRTQNRELSLEISMMEKQMDLQKERYRLFSDTAAQIQQQRHDLKHHIAAIRGGLQQGDTDRVLTYLEQMSEQIPQEDAAPLCSNDMVNAVALHYLAQAAKYDIPCTIRLDIPQDTGGVPESDLCVMIGNLLENAVTACKISERPFIRLQSRFSDGILTIAMDNRCTHTEPAADGSFPSRKPGGGIGLRSVASLAERYHGGSRFEVRGDVFLSSVFLRLSP